MEPISCVRPLCDLLTVTDVFAVRTVLYTLDKLIHRIQPGKLNSRLQRVFVPSIENALEA